MALTAEQQAQLEIDRQVFRFAVLLDRQTASCDEARRKSCEIRSCSLPRTFCIENDRNKPTGERGIAASDVTAICRHAY
jgi:hypothetical protein